MSEVNPNAWRDRVYQAYVSSGQSGGHAENTLRLELFPYQNKRIRPHLPTDRNARILDLGCGHGQLIFCLKSWGYNNVAGVDVSQEQVDLAHAKGVKEVCCGDIYDFLNQQTAPADVIMLMDVIEHLTRNELFRLLDAVRSRLSPSGLLMMHMPNAMGLFGMAIRYGDITHEAAFAPKGIQQCLKVCGYSNVKIFEDKPVVHGVKSFARYLAWEVLTVPFRILYAAECGFFPQALSQNMLVLARNNN